MGFKRGKTDIHLNINMGDTIHLDAFLGGTRKFLTDLEEHCVLACCGLNALAKSDERILRASTKVNQKILIERFNRLIAVLEENPAQKVRSNEIMEIYWNKTEVLNLIKHLRATILGIHQNTD